jgi:glutamyl-tRNA reductase
MLVLSVGVSYRRSSVDLLEKLAFPRDEQEEAYEQLLSKDSVEGGVILSTCNRVEVYAEVEAYHAGLQDLKSFLVGSRGVSADDLAQPLYSQYEDRAAEHLFAVASGIDSMMTGEPQILGQVRHSFKRAEELDAVGPMTASLFRHAINAGRRVRAETGIASSPGAFVDAGTVLAEEMLGSIEGRSLLVLGAGAMGEVAVRTLAERRPGSISILSRNPERAERLAKHTGARAHGPLVELPEHLSRADLVVSATGASGIVVDAGTVGDAMRTRGGRPQFFVDLAVPRDVDPAVAEIPGVGVANVDHLGKIVGGEDGDEIAKAWRVVGEEVERFASWRRATAMAPYIRALHDRAEQIRQHELKKANSRLADLDENQRDAVDAATKAIVNKLLHHPVAHAKAGDVPASTLSELFGLDPQHPRD